MVLAVPYHLKSLGGMCISIELLKMDSWRVKNVFKSNNRVSFEAISSYMYELKDSSSLPERISFERRNSYCVMRIPMEKLKLRFMNPEAPEGPPHSRVTTFKVDILQISKFIVGELGEPYCTIPIKRKQVSGYDY